MSLIELLVNLNEKDTLMPVLFFASFVAIILVIGVLFILKFALKYFSKKKLGVKFGDKEFSYDGSSDSDEGLERLTRPPVTDTERFASTISSVVNFAIETGYDNCRVRQALYDAQMRKIRGKCELLITNILNEYLENKGQNYEVAKVLVSHAIEKEIVQKLREVCKADRLAEKTKERVVESERPFIDSAFYKVKAELLHLASSLQKGDEILLKALESQERNIEKLITASLDEAYEDAVKYLEEVHDNNQTLHNKVNNVMKTYLESSEREKLPKEWLEDQNMTPPNRVIGE